MNNLNLDKYLNIVNEEKEKIGLSAYIPLYPMLRVENDELYVCVAITNENDNVWEIGGKTKPEYWVLINTKTNKILEFNKTSEKDFVIGKEIEKKVTNNQKEISEYTIKKQLQYQNYLIEDIKNSELPFQKKLSSLLGQTMEIDGEEANINDYLLSNLEDDIKQKVKELVGVLINSKYTSMMFYYDNLFKQVVEEYNSTNKIDKNKIKYCIQIINDYYDGLINIENLFNI